MSVAIDLLARQYDCFGASAIKRADMTEVLGSAVKVAVLGGFGLSESVFKMRIKNTSLKILGSISEFFNGLEICEAGAIDI